MIWIVFAIDAFILCYIGINRGFGKSLISFFTNLVNICISFIISRVLVNFYAPKIGDRIIESITENVSINLGELIIIR